jgi:hypothetical protein
MSRNHYEPAFGVCVFEWKAGAPSVDDAWAPVLVEIWRVGLDSGYPRPHSAQVEVNAYVAVCKQDRAQKRLVELRYTGEWEPLPEGRVIRRWAKLPSRDAILPVTVDAWRPE